MLLVADEVSLILTDQNFNSDIFGNHQLFDIMTELVKTNVRTSRIIGEVYKIHHFTGIHQNKSSHIKTKS